MSIASHFRAGTGAVLVESRGDEQRFIRQVCRDLPNAEIGVITVASPAPGAPLKIARTGKPVNGVQPGLPSAMTWAQSAPNRVLVVLDYHTVVNTPLAWRALSDAIPRLRTAGPGASSLVIFLAPSWNLDYANPLRGIIPILQFDPPSRADLREIAESLAPLPSDTMESERVVDALCGLSADAAEQAAAECLAEHRGRWDHTYLRAARREQLRQAGLEVWGPVKDLGGLGGFTEFARAEILPWVRDPALAIRRILCAGVPGVGKSYCARWLANNLGCECVRLSIPALKAGVVGASEANLRRTLRTLDSTGADSPVVCVIDEIDTIARDGLDGGTSSGMFSELLTWLQETQSQVIVLATLNRLDKLDAALESRFSARFFFDLPTVAERRAVARIHYDRVGVEDPEQHATLTALATDGFSSREIAEHVVPSVARRGSRKLSTAVISDVCSGFAPASLTQVDQLAAMRRAAASLRRANDSEPDVNTSGRTINTGGFNCEHN